MEYIKIRFCHSLSQTCSGSINEHFNQSFQVTGPIFSLYEKGWKPQMDIYEDSKNIFIKAEIAGVNKDSLEIEINTKAVKIFGMRLENLSQCQDQNLAYKLAEIQYGKFDRILFLPAPIDVDKVSAYYLDGILEIKLCKINDNQEANHEEDKN